MMVFDTCFLWQAFFTIILRDLGIQNVKAQEIFTLDQASIDFLP